MEDFQIEQLIELREKARSLLGNCGAVDGISRAVLAKLRTEWLPTRIKPVKPVHFPEFLDKL